MVSVCSDITQDYKTHSGRDDDPLALEDMLERGKEAGVVRGKEAGVVRGKEAWLKRHTVEFYYSRYTPERP